MGQQEVEDCLKNYPGEWISAKQIAAAMGVPNADIIRASLRKLREKRRIKFIMSDDMTTILYMSGGE